LYKKAILPIVVLLYSFTYLYTCMPTKKNAETSAKKSTPASTNANINEAKLAKKVWDQMEKKNGMFQTVSIVLLIVVTLLSILNCNANINNDVKSQIEEVEAMKVWGEENYKLLKKIMANEKQQEQYKQQFDLMLQQLEGDSADLGTNTPTPTEPTEPTPSEPEAPAWATLTQDTIAAISEGYKMWNADGDILFVEYSDIECPFCRRHHTNGTIKQVMENFDGKVTFMFKHYPLSFHANAQKAAEAAECVAEQLGNDQYFTYVEQAFTNGFDAPADMKSLAVQLGANEGVFTECVDSGKFADKVTGQMNEWLNLFGVRGTPGNVLINKRTWERKLISGAYPYSEFETTINDLLN